MVQIGNYTTIEQAVKQYYPIAQKMSRGDKDLQQELMLSVIDSVGSRRIYDEGLIIARMVLQRKMYKTGYLFVDRYGSSIDNGYSKRREDVELIPYNTIEETDSRDKVVDANLGIYFSDYRNPEETALFNVSYERFLNALTVRERSFWDARLEGILQKDIEKLKIAHRNQQPEIKRSIREKFREWVEG